MSVYPELVAGRHDTTALIGWTVRPGHAVRGGASCNFTDRILTVPLGPSDVERVIRAHELMHARISPMRSIDAALPPDVDPRAAECAEEFRVNYLLGQRGFDLSLLSDGSEKTGGARLATSGSWDEAICFLLAVARTRGEREYLSGIRSVRREWVAPMRAVLKRANALVESLPVSKIAATTLGPDGLLDGYGHVTIPLARLVSQVMHASAPASSKELQRFRRSLEPGARRMPTGVFAALVIDDEKERITQRRHMHHRRLRPAQSGVTLRYPSRLLTDPHQRGFGAAARRRGGVVLVDQSGSMDIDPETLTEVLRNAPDALILGYSHRPGDRGRTPNAWVLADRAGVRAAVPSGNVGNGVDGPALEWALSLRVPGEPVVWVTDGQVTDSHDHPCDSLSVLCGQMVLQHRVAMVRTMADVPKAIRGVSPLISDFGRVGRAVTALQNNWT